jgi:hypothetical protein
MMSLACVGLFLITCTDHPPITTPETVSCKLHNGTDRPYPCEFRIEKLIFLGNDGSTLGEATPTTPNVALNVSKAKTIGPIVSGNAFVTFDVKAVVRRLNAPSFPVSKGYILSYTFVESPLQSDPRTVVTATQPFDMAVGATQEATFELGFLYSGIGGGIPTFQSGPRMFFIENDVTTTKFPVVVGITLADKAEASIRIRP